MKFYEELKFLIFFQPKGWEGLLVVGTIHRSKQWKSTYGRLLTEQYLPGWILAYLLNNITLQWYDIEHDGISNH